MARGKAFTQAEDDLVRLWFEHKKPMAKLAKRLGRSRSAIYTRIKLLNREGTLNQSVMDFTRKGE